MGRWHFFIPDKLDERYEAIPAERRFKLYLAKRYFNMSPEQWDDTPWWLQATYIEGLRAEGVIRNGDDDEESYDESPGKNPRDIGELTRTPVNSNPLDATDEDFGKLGIQIADDD